MNHSMGVEIRGQPVGVTSFFPSTINNSVGSGGQTQLIRHGGKSSHPLNHLVSHILASIDNSFVVIMGCLFFVFLRQDLMM